MTGAGVELATSSTEVRWLYHCATAPWFLISIKHTFLHIFVPYILDPRMLYIVILRITIVSLYHSKSNYYVLCMFCKGIRLVVKRHVTERSRVSSLFQFQQNPYFWPIFLIFFNLNFSFFNRYTVVVIIAFFFIPAVVLITQYSWLFLLIRRLVQSAPGTKKTNRSLKERKALIIYCAMFLCFLFCCLPYMVIQLLINLDKESIQGLPSQFFEGVFLLRYIVSIVNPLLYTLYKRDFRQAANATLVVPWRKLFSKDFNDTNDARQRIYLSARDTSSYLENSSMGDVSMSEQYNNNELDFAEDGRADASIHNSNHISDHEEEGW